MKRSCFCCPSQQGRTEGDARSEPPLILEALCLTNAQGGSVVTQLPLGMEGAWLQARIAARQDDAESLNILTGVLRHSIEVACILT